MRAGGLTSYVLCMNLPFLKVRVADCPWILFDRLSTPCDELDSVEGEGLWSSIAGDICSRTRGAAADGVAVIRREKDAATIRTWDSEGRMGPPSPVSVICASRLIFDAGMAGAESLQLRSPSGPSEVIVIDSRNFGMAVGEPLSEDGKTPVDVFGKSGLRLSASAASGIVVPLMLGGVGVEVVLFDRPPEKRHARRPERIEALVVSRHELRVRRGGRDPVVAAAAAVAAAVAADYADRELAVTVGGDELVVQWPEDGPVFVAAAPSYCFSGEFWVGERRI